MLNPLSLTEVLAMLSDIPATKPAEVSDGVPEPVKESLTAKSDSCSGGACSDLHTHGHAHENRVESLPGLPGYDELARAYCNLYDKHARLQSASAEMVISGIGFINHIDLMVAKLPKTVEKVLMDYGMGTRDAVQIARSIAEAITK